MKKMINQNGDMNGIKSETAVTIKSTSTMVKSGVNAGRAGVARDKPYSKGGFWVMPTVWS
jgi:hypothetical protein